MSVHRLTHLKEMCALNMAVRTMSSYSQRKVHQFIHFEDHPLVKCPNYNSPTYKVCHCCFATGVHSLQELKSIVCPAVNDVYTDGVVHVVLRRGWRGWEWEEWEEWEKGERVGRGRVRG